MILKCKVELNNDLVTVINYNGNLVQIPSIKDKNAKFVNVWFNDGHYKVVTDDFVEPVEVTATSEKTVKKKKKKQHEELTNDEVV
jgi:hypothetical protein